MNVHVSLLLLLSNCVTFVIEAYSSLCSSFTCIHVFILKTLVVICSHP